MRRTWLGSRAPKEHGVCVSLEAFNDYCLSEPLESHREDENTCRFRRGPSGRYVHGTRMVRPVLQPSWESRIEVLDIDVHAWRVSVMAENLAATRSGLDLEQSPEVARLVSEPSAFPAGLVFVKEVSRCWLRDSASRTSNMRRRGLNSLKGRGDRQ